MIKTAKFCDLCLADDDRVLADGSYTTHEKRTFDACVDHLEEVKKHGFATRLFEDQGDFEI